MSDTKKRKRLEPKQRRFAEEYCIDFNATQAAIRAGYSEKTAYSQGSRLLKNVEIWGLIEDRLEALSMSAAEATKRLTDWGRGTIEPFLTPGGRIDITSPGAREALGLIKKLKETVTVSTDRDGGTHTTTRIEIELHDAKDAVVQIAKIRGLFPSARMEMTGKDGEPIAFIWGDALGEGEPPALEESGKKEDST